jgi:hypothetical protein
MTPSQPNHSSQKSRLSNEAKNIIEFTIDVQKLNDGHSNVEHVNSLLKNSAMRYPFK